MYTAENVSEAYLAAILAALDGYGRDPIEVAYVSAGVAPTDTACGQLTVGPELVYRSEAFPTEKPDISECAPYIAVNMLASLTRCVPTLSDTGRAPSPAAISAAHGNIWIDAGVVWNIAAGVPPDSEWEVALVRQTPAVAQGDTMTIETRWTIGLPHYDWCVAADG